MTRRIGRRESEASPTSRAVKGAAASTPASSRIVVPELPQSTSPRGGRKRPAPPAIRTRRPSAASWRATSMPRDSRQARVERQSAPVE